MDLKKTALHDSHVSLGAKMAPFGGYIMPIQYEGIVAEHMAARSAAAVFDTCHMGEFRLSGPNAMADWEELVTSSVAGMKTGQCRYGLLCNEQGGVIDDEITYRLGDNEFYIVVNAGTQDADFAWIGSHLSKGTTIENLSAETAKIDLQGPGSARIMARLMQEPIDGMTYYSFRYNRYRGKRVLTSRTGYTGEVGFEIYCDNRDIARLWNDCLELGAKPAGLGARDTLRLEVGYPLYGHELSADRNAAESGLQRSIATGKKFIGSSVINDPARRLQTLVAIELADRRAARQGDAVRGAVGRVIGTVTSGSFSPSLGKAIALAYVDAADASRGARCTIETGRSALWATIGSIPLYDRATGRRRLDEFLP